MHNCYTAKVLIIVVHRVSPLKQLLSHFRFLLTLRSQEGKYHSLILFRLTPLETNIASKFDDSEHDLLGTESKQIAQQLYAMEAQCPHLGADISHAEIEECESSLVLVCPWHRCARLNNSGCKGLKSLMLILV